MKNSFTGLVALACVASVTAAEAQQSVEQGSIETVLVLGTKQAYRGQFVLGYRTHEECMVKAR